MKRITEEVPWYENPNLLQKPGCTLQANGMGFKPQLFLSETTFDQKSIIHAGTLELPEEIKRKFAVNHPEALETFETSYLLLQISETETKATQFEEATLFLSRYQEEILRLSKFPRVEDVLMKFMTEETETPFEDFPNDFYELTRNCGISGIMY